MKQQKFRDILKTLDRLKDPNTNVRIYIEDILVTELVYCTSMYGGQFVRSLTSEGKFVQGEKISIDEGIASLTHNLRIGDSHGLILTSVEDFTSIDTEYDIEYVEETNSLVLISNATEVLKIVGDTGALEFMRHRRVLRQAIEFTKRSKRLKTDLGNLQTRFESIILVPNQVGEMQVASSNKEAETLKDYKGYKFIEGEVPRPVVVLPNITRMGAQVTDATKNFSKIYRKLDLVDYLFPEVTSKLRRVLSTADDLLVTMMVMKDNPDFIDMKVILAATDDNQIKNLIYYNKDLNLERYKSDKEKYTGFVEDNLRFLPYDYLSSLMIKLSVVVEEEGKDNLKILKERLRQEW